MKNYWIYISKNNEGLIDCNYYQKELSPIPKHLLFVGTAKLSREYFGDRVVDKFQELFDRCAEKKIKELNSK